MENKNDIILTDEEAEKVTGGQWLKDIQWRYCNDCKCNANHLHVKTWDDTSLEEYYECLRCGKKTYVN